MTGVERQPDLADLRARIGAWIESERVQRIIVALILVNAVTLGLETSDSVMAAAGGALAALDSAILALFVAEIAAKLFARGLRFFRDGWNVFDFLVVGVTLLPATGNLSVLRTLRILRALRLISAVPRLRRVVEALLASLPGLGSIAALLLIVFYVGAVMATKLFGEAFPAEFGSLGASMFTLFQIMTLEGWADLARAVMEVQPYAWIFFLSFILVATFAMLNLIVAIIVNSLQEMQEEESAETRAAMRAVAQQEAGLAAEVAALRREIEVLRRDLAARETQR